MWRDYLVPQKANEAHVGPLFALQVCDSAKTMAGTAGDAAGAASLSADYYKGDRGMRESGYAVSFRFGPHWARAHHLPPTLSTPPPHYADTYLIPSVGILCLH